MGSDLIENPFTFFQSAFFGLRVERQLGYKQATYVMRVEVADRIDMIGGGTGGFWDERRWHPQAFRGRGTSLHLHTRPG